MCEHIRHTARVRRGLKLVYSQAIADSATRNMRRDNFSPEEEAEFKLALGWIDQESQDPVESGEPPEAGTSGPA